MSYPTPRNFNPSQEDKERIGKKIAANLSSNKTVVVSEEIKIRGNLKEQKFKVEGYSLIGTRKEWNKKIHDMYFQECCDVNGFNPPNFNSFVMQFKLIKVD